ncbi:hypothetical protein OROMI_008063 [Orobanche minor]
MDIPAQFQSKIGVYNIQIDDVKIKATMITKVNMLDTCLCELKSLIDNNLPVVGVDVKQSTETPYTYLLLLYVKGCCFIIQLHQIGQFPSDLGHFLSDSSICFVGYGIDQCFDGVRAHYKYSYHDHLLTGKGAEVRNLAAVVLKNNSLKYCSSVGELATNSGLIDIKGSDEYRIVKSPYSGDNYFFTDEEVKFIIADAFHCYLMGNKLLGILDLVK